MDRRRVPAPCTGRCLTATYARVTVLADGGRRGGRLEREATAEAVVEAEVDAAEDWALIDAFSAANAATMGGEAAWFLPCPWLGKAHGRP